MFNSFGVIACLADLIQPTPKSQNSLLELRSPEGVQIGFDKTPPSFALRQTISSVGFVSSPLPGLSGFPYQGFVPCLYLRHVSSARAWVLRLDCNAALNISSQLKPSSFDLLLSSYHISVGLFITFPSDCHRYLSIQTQSCLLSSSRSRRRRHRL